MSIKKFDAIILGAGPAGLTSGIYMARAKKKIAIIDKGTIGGQIILSHTIANYPGLDELPGYKLANTMKKQAKKFGCIIKSNIEITEIDIKGKLKKIKLEDDSEYEAPAIIIATGGSPRNLGIKSENKFKGNGISYCATCDGDFFLDKNIIVVGGGNSALEEAVSLSTYAKNIKIIHQFDHFQAYPYAIKEAKDNNKIEFLMETVVEEFLGNESMNKVKLKNLKTDKTYNLAIDGAFIFIGYIPNSKIFKNIIKLSKNSEIISDKNMKTNLNGVFVAGDIREKKIRQITTAVSDGTIAAINAIEYINSFDN